MLNNAAEPHARQLNEIVERAETERAILGGIAESDLADKRIQYIAAYVLIRIGNTVAQHSRRLERAYPDYRWVFWVDLRNNLAHELRNVDVRRVWGAVARELPDLIEAITGERPLPPARRATLT